MLEIHYGKGFFQQEHDGIRPFRWMQNDASIHINDTFSGVINIPYATLTQETELCFYGSKGKICKTIYYGWHSISIDMKEIGSGEVQISCPYSFNDGERDLSVQIGEITEENIIQDSIYARAGIHDIAQFYQDKFAPQIKAVIPTGVDCYRSESLKKMWLYSNIPEGSKVLDFGCGSGALGFLKQKNCELIGIDYSEAGTKFAVESNGYDAAFAGTLDDFSWPKKYFDFIVSLDVFGHIEFGEKDRTIEQLKSYLKDDGIMMHGIECGPLNYDSLSKEQLEEFVKVDGHVGIESKHMNYERFKKFFDFIDGEVRYTMLLPIREYKKQISSYSTMVSSDLKEYLFSLSPEEEKAFDIAAGLSQIALDTHNVASKESDGGFLFLRASNAPLPKLSFEPVASKKVKEHELNKNLIEESDIFLSGWYEIEEGSLFGGTPQKYRFGTSEARLRIKNAKGKILQISAFSYFSPEQTNNPFLYFINEETKDYTKIPLTEKKVDCSIPVDSDDFFLRCGSSVSGIPVLFNQGSDYRLLSIGLSSISLVDKE